jgi:hypothetical protein
MQARSWKEIENHYLELNKMDWNHYMLLELVIYIQSSGLSNKLWATTSLDRLIISNNNEIDFDKESLHVKFDRQNQKWLFKYFGGQLKNHNQPEFEKTYKLNEGKEKLINFIKMINW